MVVFAALLQLCKSHSVACLPNKSHAFQRISPNETCIPFPEASMSELINAAVIQRQLSEHVPVNEDSWITLFSRYEWETVQFDDRRRWLTPDYCYF